MNFNPDGSNSNTQAMPAGPQQTQFPWLPPLERLRNAVIRGQRRPPFLANIQRLRLQIQQRSRETAMRQLLFTQQVSAALQLIAANQALSEHIAGIGTPLGMAATHLPEAVRIVVDQLPWRSFDTLITSARMQTLIEERMRSLQREADEANTQLAAIVALERRAIGLQHWGRMDELQTASQLLDELERWIESGNPPLDQLRDRTNRTIHAEQRRSPNIPRPSDEELRLERLQLESETQTLATWLNARQGGQNAPDQQNLQALQTQVQFAFGVLSQLVNQLRGDPNQDAERAFQDAVNNLHSQVQAVIQVLRHLDPQTLQTFLALTVVAGQAIQFRQAALLGSVADDLQAIVALHQTEQRNQQEMNTAQTQDDEARATVLNLFHQARTAFAARQDQLAADENELNLMTSEEERANWRARRRRQLMNEAKDPIAREEIMRDVENQFREMIETRHRNEGQTTTAGQINDEVSAALNSEQARRRIDDEVEAIVNEELSDEALMENLEWRQRLLQYALDQARLRQRQLDTWETLGRTFPRNREQWPHIERELEAALQAVILQRLNRILDSGDEIEHDLRRLDGIAQESEESVQQLRGTLKDLLKGGRAIARDMRERQYQGAALSSLAQSPAQFEEQINECAALLTDLLHEERAIVERQLHHARDEVRRQRNQLRELPLLTNGADDEFVDLQNHLQATEEDYDRLLRNLQQSNTVVDLREVLNEFLEIEPQERYRWHDVQLQTGREAILRDRVLRRLQRSLDFARGALPDRPPFQAQIREASRLLNAQTDILESIEDRLLQPLEPEDLVYVAEQLRNLPEAGLRQQMAQLQEAIEELRQTAEAGRQRQQLDERAMDRLQDANEEARRTAEAARQRQRLEERAMNQWLTENGERLYRRLRDRNQFLGELQQRINALQIAAEDPDLSRLRREVALERVRVIRHQTQLGAINDLQQLSGGNYNTLRQIRHEMNPATLRRRNDQYLAAFHLLELRGLLSAATRQQREFRALPRELRVQEQAIGREIDNQLKEIHGLIKKLQALGPAQHYERVRLLDELETRLPQEQRRIEARQQPLRQLTLQQNVARELERGIDAVRRQQQRIMNLPPSLRTPDIVQPVTNQLERLEGIQRELRRLRDVDDTRRPRQRAQLLQRLAPTLAGGLVAILPGERDLARDRRPLLDQRSQQAQLLKQIEWAEEHVQRMQSRVNQAQRWLGDQASQEAQTAIANLNVLLTGQSNELRFLRVALEVPLSGEELAAAMQLRHTLQQQWDRANVNQEINALEAQAAPARRELVRRRLQQEEARTTDRLNQVNGLQRLEGADEQRRLHLRNIFQAHHDGIVQLQLQLQLPQPQMTQMAWVKQIENELTRRRQSLEANGSVQELNRLIVVNRDRGRPAVNSLETQDPLRQGETHDDWMRNWQANHGEDVREADALQTAINEGDTVAPPSALGQAFTNALYVGPGPNGAMRFAIQDGGAGFAPFEVPATQQGQIAQQAAAQLNRAMPQPGDRLTFTTQWRRDLNNATEAANIANEVDAGAIPARPAPTEGETIGNAIFIGPRPDGAMRFATYDGPNANPRVFDLPQHLQGQIRWAAQQRHGRQALQPGDTLTFTATGRQWWVREADNAQEAIQIRRAIRNRTLTPQQANNLQAFNQPWTNGDTGALFAARTDGGVMYFAEYDANEQPTVFTVPRVLQGQLMQGEQLTPHVRAQLPPDRANPALQPGDIVNFTAQAPQQALEKGLDKVKKIFNKKK